MPHPSARTTSNQGSYTGSRDITGEPHTTRSLVHLSTQRASESVPPLMLDWPAMSSHSQQEGSSQPHWHSNTPLRHKLNISNNICGAGFQMNGDVLNPGEPLEPLDRTIHDNQCIGNAVQINGIDRTGGSVVRDYYALFATGHSAARSHSLSETPTRVATPHY